MINSKLKPYDENILTLMYIAIFEIQPKYLRNKTGVSKVKAEALEFFSDDYNFSILQDYYSNPECVQAQWNK